MGVLLYLIQVIGLVAVVFIFNWVHYRLEIIRLKRQLLNDLMQNDYEVSKIDINNYLK